MTLQARYDRSIWIRLPFQAVAVLLIEGAFWAWWTPPYSLLERLIGYSVGYAFWEAYRHARG